MYVWWFQKRWQSESAGQYLCQLCWTNRCSNILCCLCCWKSYDLWFGCLQCLQQSSLSKTRILHTPWSSFPWLVANTQTPTTHSTQLHNSSWTSDARTSRISSPMGKAHRFNYQSCTTVSPNYSGSMLVLVRSTVLVYSSYVRLMISVLHVRTLRLQIVRDMLDFALSIQLKQMGLVTLFNGMDITQTRHYVKIHCTTYINHIWEKYLSDWMADSKVSADCPLPLPSKESSLKEFTDIIGDADPKTQSALKGKHHVGYRNLIGELMYAIVTCWPNISFATVKCAQSSAAPTHIHRKAGKSVMRYLYSTHNDGIYYWRSEPNDELPDHTLPDLSSKPSDILREGRPIHRPCKLHGYMDSDWVLANEYITLSRHLFTLGRWHHCIQGTLLSIEVEFMAAVDCAKTTLYIRSILYDLNIPDYAATHLYEDNDACIAMWNAGKPTTRTCHMDIRYYALCEWVERDLVVLERINTSQNPADHITKNLPRISFHQHVDYIMRPVPQPHSPHFMVLVLPEWTLNTILQQFSSLWLVLHVHRHTLLLYLSVHLAIGITKARKLASIPGDFGFFYT